MSGAPRRFAWRFLGPPLLLLAATLAVLAADANLTLWIALREHLLPWGATSWSALTLVGDALVTPLLIVPFLHRRRALAVEALLAALLATAGVHLLKPLVHMPRPAAVIDGIVVIGPRLMAGSFPSGHTASAFTVLGLLVLGGLVRGWLPALAALGLALLVGLSRVVVGAHWPADVLAGAALGWCSAGLAVVLVHRWRCAARPAWLPGVLLLLALVAGFDLFGHDTGYPAGLWLQRILAALTLPLLLWQWQHARVREGN
ncbi:MAG: phosphatase PAP2 family protein [Pseudomonadota bacterium]|nr:phosphatase PAP2 family protein [Pseudomonadota bacterium]